VVAMIKTAKGQHKKGGWHLIVAKMKEADLEFSSKTIKSSVSYYYLAQFPGMACWFH
jgi:hypothetical protein